MNAATETPGLDESAWTWYGAAGHFIGAADCRFHLCTEVARGRFLVSTVGDYYPDPEAAEPTEIGPGRLQETMVFATDPSARCPLPECGCGMPEVTDWSELDSQGYRLRGDAQRGHMALCRKWAQR